MSLLNTRKRRYAVVAVVAVAAIGGGAAAFAYWTANGTGTGTATTGASSDFTITSTPPVGDPLTPGAGVQTVTFTVTNVNSGGELQGPVFANVANADGSPWTAIPGCSAADYTVTAPDILQGILPGGGSREGTVQISMNETGTDQDACQGVTVPLFFTTNAP